MDEGEEDGEREERDRESAASIERGTAVVAAGTALEVDIGLE